MINFGSREAQVGLSLQSCFLRGGPERKTRRKLRNHSRSLNIGQEDTGLAISTQHPGVL
jgi:hypothetical protein